MQPIYTTIVDPYAIYLNTCKPLYFNVNSNYNYVTVYNKQAVFITSVHPIYQCIQSVTWQAYIRYSVRMIISVYVCMQKLSCIVVIVQITC